MTVCADPCSEDENRQVPNKCAPTNASMENVRKDRKFCECIFPQITGFDWKTTLAISKVHRPALSRGFVPAHREFSTNHVQPWPRAWRAVTPGWTCGTSLGWEGHHRGNSDALKITRLNKANTTSSCLFRDQFSPSHFQLASNPILSNSRTRTLSTSFSKLRSQLRQFKRQSSARRICQ